MSSANNVFKKYLEESGYWEGESEDAQNERAVLLEGLDEAGLKELSSMRLPPKVVATVMGFVALAVGKGDSWGDVREALAKDDFVESLKAPQRYCDSSWVWNVCGALQGVSRENVEAVSLTTATMYDVLATIVTQHKLEKDYSAMNELECGDEDGEW